MRCQWLLIILTMGFWLVACNSTTKRPEPTTSVLVPYDSGASGASLIVSGVLTHESFKPRSIRVIGWRLAGKSSDPDQFRVQLLDPLGRELGVQKMWSPLLRFVWNAEGEREAVQELDNRDVQISVPVSILVNQIVLSWPNGREVARIKVGGEIRTFCLQTPENPACTLPAI